MAVADTYFQKKRCFYFKPGYLFLLLSVKGHLPWACGRIQMGLRWIVWHPWLLRKESCHTNFNHVSNSGNKTASLCVSQRSWEYTKIAINSGDVQQISSRKSFIPNQKDATFCVFYQLLLFYSVSNGRGQTAVQELLCTFFGYGEGSCVLYDKIRKVFLSLLASPYI